MFAAGCNALTPEFSYQGRLTDASGTPLNGNFTITFKLFDASSGGTEIYTETETVAVSNGLFDVAIGPTSGLTSLDPADLTQPLWLEVTINDGTYTEILGPRQHLYGAPYAFTLMAGSVISGELNTSVYGTSNIKSALTVQNPYDGNVSDPALPALRVIGETAVELSDPIPISSGIGKIVSKPDDNLSDLGLCSRDDIYLQLDTDGAGTGWIYILDGAGNIICDINESGDLSCDGDSSFAGSKSAVVDINGESRLLYTMESPEVWFEDFGTGTLVNGTAEVVLEPLFVKTVSLEDYHVFLTPLGDCNGLFIVEKTQTSFTVKELGGGTSNISFDYRIVAHRLGYENERLELDSVRSSPFAEE